jgi:hypothetical protein
LAALRSAVKPLAHVRALWHRCAMGPTLIAALLLALVLPAAPAGAQDWLTERPEPKAGHAYPTPYCMNRRERVELGQTTCVRTNCCPITGCETFVARCEMSTNNTTFRKVQDGCPAEGLTERAAPPASFPPARG